MITFASCKLSLISKKVMPDFASLVYLISMVFAAKIFLIHRVIYNKTSKS